MITVTTYRGDHRLDEAEAETPEDAAVAALTMMRDDMTRWHNSFPGRLYAASFAVEGGLTCRVNYQTVYAAAAS